MAMNRGGGGAFSGVGSFVKNFIWVFILGALIFGAGKAWVVKYDIQNVGDAISFFRERSAQTENSMRPCVEDILSCKIGDSGSSNNENSSGNSENSVDNSSGASTDGIATVEESQVSYNRDEWLPGKKWSDFNGDGCDTREEVLKMSGQNVETNSKTCKVLSGSWVSPYNGDKITESSKIDIDHIIPLSYAAKHGGQNWDNVTKEQFANDLENLVAVDSSSNRSKGDKGPAQWLPSNEAYQCQYAKDWIKVSKKYSLGLSGSDIKTLNEVLSSKC